jgi:hypothetical protein
MWRRKFSEHVAGFFAEVTATDRGPDQAITTYPSRCVAVTSIDREKIENRVAASNFIQQQEIYQLGKQHRP